MLFEIRVWFPAPVIILGEGNLWVFLRVYNQWPLWGKVALTHFWNHRFGSRWHLLVFTESNDNLQDIRWQICKYYGLWTTPSVCIIPGAKSQDYKEKHKTRLKTNIKRTVLNNTKLRHFWAPIHARKTFIILAPGITEAEQARLQSKQMQSSRPPKA